MTRLQGCKRKEDVDLWLLDFEAQAEVQGAPRSMWKNVARILMDRNAREYWTQASRMTSADDWDKTVCKFMLSCFTQALGIMEIRARIQNLRPRAIIHEIVHALKESNSVYEHRRRRLTLEPKIPDQELKQAFLRLCP
eukprot:GHVP01063770.1.p1 GENE.GHVP01063770.1~~GHVP01063770.1.p1  ORF type:complete len:138 (-),score=15.07 GHVP01063770.1:221-634(-)